MEESQAAHRPGGVTAAGVLVIVVASLGLIMATLLLIFGGLIGGAARGGKVSGLPAGAGGELEALMIIAGVLMAVIASVELWAGIGVLHGRPAARVVALVFAWLGVLGNALSIGAAAIEGHWGLLASSLPGLALWGTVAYLLSKERAAFRRPAV